MARTRTAARIGPGCVVAAVVMGLLAGGCTSPDDGFSDCASDADGPGALVGMDAATGEQRWTRTVGDATVLAAGGELVRIGNGRVEAFDVTTGEARWCRPDAYSPSSETPASSATTVVADDALVVLSEGEVTVFDLATGELRWATTVPAGTNPSLSVTGGRVLVRDATDMTTATTTSAGSSAGPTVSVLGLYDLATGAVLHAPVEVPTDEEVILGWLASRSGGLIVTSSPAADASQQEVAVRDHATGRQLWTHTMPSIGAHLDGDLVLVVDQPLGLAERGTGGTTLVALRAADGTELWRTTFDAVAPTPNPGFTDDLVLWTIGTEIRAFDRVTGAHRWTVDHGSPGRGGDTSEPGTYRSFEANDDGSTVGGYIVAVPPQRD
jgi:outer membrane protein assembly factor BamB